MAEEIRAEMVANVMEIVAPVGSTVVLTISKEAAPVPSPTETQDEEDPSPSPSTSEGN